MYGETSYLFLFFKIFQNVEQKFKIVMSMFIYLQKSGSFDQFFLVLTKSFCVMISIPAKNCDVTLPSFCTIIRTENKL